MTDTPETESGRLRKSDGGWAKRILYDAPRAVVAALFLAGLLLNFANVVGRYVFQRPIMSAEEVLIYLMIWCIFVGAALVTYEGSHLRMDLVVNRVRPSVAKGLEILGAVVFLVIAVAVVRESASIVELVATMDEKSVVARVPMEIPYAALPVSFALMAVAAAWRLIALVRHARGGR